ncbi:MAG: hypothetical protein ACI97A_001626 [Planctomycetota bacterium]
MARSSSVGGLGGGRLRRRLELIKGNKRKESQILFWLSFYFEVGLGLLVVFLVHFGLVVRTKVAAEDAFDFFFNHDLTLLVLVTDQ